MEMNNIDSDEPCKIDAEKIKEAYSRLKNVLNRTPVHTSGLIDSIIGKKIYFKCENFQKTGSFKARGALNAVLSKPLLNENNVGYSGFITHSSGNHGTALSWACHNQNIPGTIVLPKNTPQVKVDSVLAYGATIEFCESNPVSREETCKRLSEQNRLLIVNPYDDYDVMCGQGTVACEFLEQVPNLDAILVSVSGGGLISGISVYAKSINPSIKIIAVEPVGKRLSECLSKKERNLDNKPQTALNTQAEGIRMEQCGHLTFPIMSKYIQPDDVFTVSDEEMIEATKLIFKRMKLVIELSAGAAVAAAISQKMKDNYPDLKNVGVILCGGNIDIENFPWNNK